MRFKLRRPRWLTPARLLTVTLIVQLLGLVFWGLTWPERSPVQLAFVVPQDEVRPWETVIAGFEANYPNIHIELVTDPVTTYTTDQRMAIYSADFQGETARYDLVYMDIVWPAQFMDQLVDLRPLIERDGVDLSGFLDSELSVGRRDQALYRLPMRADLGVLYYRQDLLEAIGVPLPTTLTELAEAVALLRQSSEADLGYLWQGRSYEGLIAYFMEVLHNLDATWIDSETGQVGLDQPAAQRAAQLLLTLLEQEISPQIVTDYTEQSALAAFQAGEAPFLRGWPYFWTELERQGWQDKVAIALPFSFTSKPGVGCRGGWGFGIPLNSVHREAAWQAISYFTSAAAQKQFVLASGYLPSRQSLFQDPDVVARYPLMPQLLAFLEESSVFRPAIQQYDRASEILQRALGKILRRQQSVAAAMTQAQRETEALLR